MDLLSSNATYSMFIKLLNCTEGKDGRHFHNLSGGILVGIVRGIVRGMVTD